jgi:hypothetical protein
MAARSVTKSGAVLRAVLDARPAAVGFVLPRAFLDERKFETERERVERQFVDIELVALPEGTFKFSSMESALLIARSPRDVENARSTSLRSSMVKQRDREAFLQFGKISTSRVQVRPYSESAAGHLWIRELDELWQYIAEYPTLGDVVDIHRGIEWKGDQSQAVSKSARSHFRRGLHSADSVRAFLLGSPIWLDMRPERLRRAVDLPWRQTKLVTNAVRLSRGPWRLAAAVDSNGLVFSQQLFGCWPKGVQSDVLPIIAAVLNGPLANAFLALHSPAKGIRVSTMRALPLPPVLPREVAPLVAAYVEEAASRALELEGGLRSRAQSFLDEIDALVLKAYDIPPRLERELLEMFRNTERPTIHDWQHWLPEDLGLAVPLYEYLSGEYSKATQNWVLDVFTALPESEAAVLRDYTE